MGIGNNHHSPNAYYFGEVVRMIAKVVSEYNLSQDANVKISNPVAKITVVWKSFKLESNNSPTANSKTIFCEAAAIELRSIAKI